MQKTLDQMAVGINLNGLVETDMNQIVKGVRSFFVKKGFQVNYLKFL